MKIAQEGDLPAGLLDTEIVFARIDARARARGTLVSFPNAEELRRLVRFAYRDRRRGASRGASAFSPVCLLARDDKSRIAIDLTFRRVTEYANGDCSEPARDDA